MAVTRISQSSIKEGLEKYTSFYGGLSGALFGQYDPIATVTVGSGGASSITFSDIPGTYQHLQIRVQARVSGGTGAFEGNAWLRPNNDTGNNYAYHQLYGDGSTASAFGAASGGVRTGAAFIIGSNSVGAAIIDILDYTSTTKNKTIRSFCGTDNNGSGSLALVSGLWTNTAAITSMTFVIFNSLSYAQHSQVSLYGLRAP